MTTITDYAKVAAILHFVGASFGFTKQQLLSRNRSEPLVWARQIAMALAREQTGCTWPELGTIFARHGATVVYAKQAVDRRTSVYPMEAARVRELRKQTANATLH